MILGSIVGIIIFIFVALLVHGSMVGPGLDKESKAWADASIPKIVMAWNADEIFNNGSVGFLQTVPKPKLQELFTIFSAKLGKLEKYSGATGQAGIHWGPSGETITAEYVANTEFEKGSAKILITGVQEKGVWKISGFRINSEALVK